MVSSVDPLSLGMVELKAEISFKLTTALQHPFHFDRTKCSIYLGSFDILG